MKLIDIFIRYSDQNIRLEKVITLSQQGRLIYNDGDGGLKTHLSTSTKFALLTIVSPLLALARLIRSVVFLCKGDLGGTGREFLGTLALPFMASGCFIGSLLSSTLYVISAGNISFYISMRRAYAYFEAWVNRIDFKCTYSHRATGALDFFKGRIWTTAPCMQPLLEQGFSAHGGLLDLKRMQKVFPFIDVQGVLMEGDKVVIQSRYANENTHYTACNGACEHRKISTTCFCCYRMELIVDRILCCELGQGTCKSIGNSGDSCGIVSASCSGVGVCCCYIKEDNNLVAVNTGCFDPNGLYCVNTFVKVTRA